MSYVAIIDYGLGNLFSVKHACSYVGLESIITSSKQEILQSDAVILPGVGAFGDAMKALGKLDLISPIRDIVASQKPLIGICLGMQLLMTESYEFGHHKGLDIIPGSVIKLEGTDPSAKIRVPHVGWNRVFPSNSQLELSLTPWLGSPLASVTHGDYMYFIHSFYVQPESNQPILSLTNYKGIEFCSSMKYGSIFAFQFHPERSGMQGLNVYRNLSHLITTKGG